MAVQAWGWEEPLEKGKANPSSILAWKIPRIAEPGGLSPQCHRESDTTEHLSAHTEHGKLMHQDRPALAQGGGWTQEGGLQKRMRNFVCVMTEVTVSQIYALVKTHRTVHFK